MINRVEATKDMAIERVVNAAVRIPGIKVDRDKFLTEVFSSEETDIQNILDNGPINANISRERLNELADELIASRTNESSAVPINEELPDDLEIKKVIPSETLLFFSSAARLAQELSYLYGSQDFWKNDRINSENVRSQLILYCGVMLGVSGAVSGIRVLTAQLADSSFKKLPQKVLTKTALYPIIKQVGKVMGVKITKSKITKGFSNALPKVGGFVSGGLNYATMKTMAQRLHTALDSVYFESDEKQLSEDIEKLNNAEYVDVDDELIENAETEAVSDNEKDSSDIKSKVSNGLKGLGGSISGIFSKKDSKKK